MAPPPPPPPPPPAPAPPPPAFSISNQTNAGSNAVPPPDIPAKGPPNAVLVSLLVYNGWPFADHWEYFAASPLDSTGNTGVVVQAAGDVRGGFWLEVKRGWSLLENNGGSEGAPADGDGGRTGTGSGDGGRGGGRGVAKRVPLAWVDGRLFEADDGYGGDGEDGKGDGGASRRVRGVFEGGKDGEVVLEGRTSCEFERMLFKVPAPEKTLRPVDREGSEGNRITKITQRNCQTWVLESAEQLVREGVLEQRVVDYLRATSIMMRTSH